MSLTISTRHHGEVAVVSVAGELDMGTAPPLQQQVTQLIEDGHRRLVFDLSDLAFCDSTGLSVFVRARNSLDQRDGAVRLAAPRRGVLRILQVSGLVEVLPTFPTVDGAIAEEPVVAAGAAGAGAGEAASGSPEPVPAE